MAKTKNLVIDQGTSFYANVQYLDDNKHPISLVGYDVRSKMRKSYNSSNSASIGVSITNAATGNVQLYLSPIQTAGIKSGRYVYDVEANIGSDVVRIVEGLVTVYPTASGVSTGSLFTSPQLVSVSDDDFTTANIRELTNLFYTNARVYSNVVTALNAYSGNINVTGGITKTQFNSGEIIKTTMYSAAELTILAEVNANTNNFTDVVEQSYTPVYSNSYLMIDFTTRYTASGAGHDSFTSQIAVDGNQIAYNNVDYVDGSDGRHHRFGVLFPLMGRYTNANTDSKLITISMKRDSADDNITIYPDNSMWLRVTEVAV